MVKNLLLLGLLKTVDTHGYRLSEFLEKSIGLGISIKKGNAYRLLNEMRKQGWVECHEKREGNRPPKQIYSLTADGEEMFQKLLRESLNTYTAADIPNAASLNYLSMLPADEAVFLLEKRREVLKARADILKNQDAAFLEIHRGIDFISQYHDFELAFLDNLISSLKKNAHSGK